MAAVGYGVADMGIRFSRNVGRFDQILRIGIGFILIWVGFIDDSLIGDPMIGFLVGAFGSLNLIAALLRVCPVYSVAGINTNNQED